VILQQLCFYNIFYYITFAILNIALATYKYRNYSEWRVSYVTPAIVALYTVIEPYRLSLGYKGNVLEQVPQLLAFIFLTFFFCLIYLFYFLAMQYPLLPIDRALNIINAAFALSQFIAAIVAVRGMVGYKTEQFRIQRHSWRPAQASPSESAPLTGAESDRGAQLLAMQMRQRGHDIGGEFGASRVDGR
jgi:hypothetical protein